MTRARISISGAATSGCSRLFISSFLSAFMIAGLLFVGVMVSEIVAVARTCTWREAPCTIVESSVGSEAEGGSFAIHIAYRYRWDGRNYTSRTFRTRGASISDVARAERVVDRYPAGAATRCFVDPREPSRAVLERGSLWFAAFILLPMAFVAIGAGGLWMVWRRQPATPSGLTSLTAGSERARKAPRYALFVLFAFFTLIGGGATYAMLARPLLGVARAARWPAVPCRVLSSSVGAHRGSDSTTYSIDIVYEYQIGGRRYRSGRYDFLGGSSSGSAGKERVVAAYPEGADALCYVNPADPHDAVLERGFRSSYLVGLIPVLFLLIGVGGTVATLRRPRLLAGGAPRVPGRAVEGSARREPAQEGPVELRPKTSPLAKVLGMAFVAVFWNGIVGVFVVVAAGEWRSGGAPIGMSLFLVPFVLIGLALLVGLGSSVLALFNPRVTLRLVTGRPALGETVDLEWRISGSVDRISRLRVHLEGAEEATYRRGTNSHTDRETFADITVYETTSPSEMRQGEARVTVPEDTMHSFVATNNKVVWSLKVHGDIARWPDVDDDYAIDVQPQRLQEGA